MSLRFLPVRSKLSFIRFLFLLGLLIVCLVYVFVIYKINRSHIGPAADGFTRMLGARVFEASVSKVPSRESKEIEADANYAHSLAAQASIAAKCEAFLSTSGVTPRSESKALDCGLSPTELRDPWGHPFKVRLLNPELLLVESTGPSGLDRIAGREKEIIEKGEAKAAFLDGDNLVVVHKVSLRKVELR